ncbi:YaeQ family protein [Porticoccaceae bacterium]|nr:YaeQ family protein [Porticoccaceae bacterium]MDA8902896.1 YaeQ family protein [Porticoccaceae bacterium]MDA8919806.1 YaeQ family protein [Porticoccaceae bacterium]
MALSATICKADLNIVDMDRHYYQQHSLTVAQHPSENDERLMIRLLAFALHADEFLSFTKGLSTDDEPDLWQKSLSGEIELWIELGLPSEKRLKKACGRAQQVILYTYGTGSAEQWWKQIQPQVSRFKNLSVRHLDSSITRELASGMRRNLDIQISIQDSEVTWDSDQKTLSFRPEVRY